MRCGDIMDASEILDMIAVINDMENISSVEVTIGEASFKIEKGVNKVVEPMPPTKFSTATDFSNGTVSNKATPGQVKFALDLANKVSNGNMTHVVNGLAHALELRVEDILHPDRWEAEMTREEAGEYLDILEAQYNKVKKAQGGWG